MFGNLRPNPLILSCDERRAWRSVYCGMCHSLGQYHGSASRATLSHDVVFWAAVVEALQERAAATTTTTCPLAPWQRHEVLTHESVAMQAGASLQVLLGDAWLRDQGADGRRLLGAMTRWTTPHAEEAMARMERLGLSLRPVFDTLQTRQDEAEALEGATLEALTAPTRALMRALFQELGALPGAAPTARTPAAQEALGQLGESLGELIYLMDALRDLRADLIQGAFNFCLTTTPRGTRVISRARVTETRRRMERALGRLRHAHDALPWRRHRALLDHLLHHTLPHRARHIATRATTLATRHGEDDRPLLARLHLAWIAVWMWAAHLARVLHLLTRRRPPQRTALPDRPRLQYAYASSGDQPPRQLPGGGMREHPEYERYMEEQRELERYERHNEEMMEYNRGFFCCEGLWCCEGVCAGLECLSCLCACAN